MTLNDDHNATERLTDFLREQEETALTPEQIEAKEDEFEHQLFAKGVISHIPTRDETDEEFDKFVPIEVEGEPLSETLIRERR